MFVFSLKSRGFKLAIICVLVALAAVATVLLLRTQVPVPADSAISYEAKDAKGRVDFLSQFGWEVNSEPVEVTEIVIPVELDEVYLQYNAIQLEQGLDLEAFCGCRAKRWSYTVKNYPDASEDYIRANLIICDGKVIAGDICSIEADGFMHGFARPLSLSKKAD